MTITYSDFEAKFLVASLASEDRALTNDPQSHGVIAALDVARLVLPEIPREWIQTAVRTFEDRGWVRNVSRALSGKILLQLTGDGRRRAEAITSSYSPSL